MNSALNSSLKMAWTCSTYCLVFAFATAVSARPIPILTYEELAEKSDAIVIADALETQPAKTTTPGTPLPTGWAQVETMLRVHLVLKGEITDETLTFVHLRPITNKGRSLIGGPTLLTFNTEGNLWHFTFDRHPAWRKEGDRFSKAKYLLFLNRLEDGRYEAATGQRDSIEAVKQLAHPGLIHSELAAIESPEEDSEAALPKPFNLQDSPGKIAKQFREVFQVCDDQSLRQLQLHPELSVSLFASWEEVIRRCTAAQASLDDSCAQREYDRSLASFVGFFEGRVNTKVPRWWRRAIQQAEPHFEEMSGKKYLYEFVHEGPCLPLIEVAPRIVAEPNTTVQIEDKSVKIGRPDFNLTLARTILDEVADGQTTLSNVVVIAKRVDDDTAMVVIYGGLPSDPCWIAQVATHSSIIRWQQRVRFAPDHTGFLSGAGPWHDMSLKFDAKQVILFGQGPFGVYAAGFSTTDGRFLFRFFSEGWTAFD